MRSEAKQKHSAVELHNHQAELFQQRYRSGGARPYLDCFNYSRHRLQPWLDRVLPENGAGLRVLDIGCGTGHQIANLRERGFEVSGADASEEMLRLAQINNPHADIRYSDVDNLDFPDETFDFAICIEVLRYLPKPANCIAQVRRVLKPGGAALVTAVPLFNANAYWLVNRVARTLAARNGQHIKQFFVTSARLRAMFLRQGFASAEVHGVFTGPVNWVERLCRPALPRFLRLWEPLDKALADAGPLRELSNMFVVRAVR